MTAPQTPTTRPLLPWAQPRLRLGAHAPQPASSSSASAPPRHRKAQDSPNPCAQEALFFLKRRKRFINKGVLTEKNRTVELDATPGSTWLKPPDFPEEAGETRRRGAARPRPLGRSFQPLCVTLGTARSPAPSTAPSTATSATAPTAARAAPSSPARVLRCPPSGARPPATPVQQRPVLPTAFSRASPSRPGLGPAAPLLLTRIFGLVTRRLFLSPVRGRERRQCFVATCRTRPPAGCGHPRDGVGSADYGLIPPEQVALPPHESGISSPSLPFSQFARRRHGLHAAHG